MSTPAGDRVKPVPPVLLAALLWLLPILGCPSRTPESSTSSTAAEPAKTESSAAGSLKALEAQVDSLSDRVKELGSRLDSQPKPAPVDLAPIRNKIDEIAKSTEGIDSLAKTVGTFEARVAALDKSIADLRSEVASVKGQAQPGTASASPAETGTATIEQGAELFQAGKFKEASDVFRKVTQTNPDDARGWYYLALSTGFATQKWSEEPVRLVTKGVEREKAGTPDSAKIDATFAKLGQATGKSWLDYYRKTARK